MTKREFLDKLSNYKNGGDALLLYNLIEINSVNNICFIDQESLAQNMNRNRRTVSNALKTLSELNLIKTSYKKIEIINEVENEK